MYASPIEARCRHCNNEFYLYELVDRQDGSCPRCATLLSPDWTPALLEEARRADGAQELLVRSLRRLTGIPGNFELLPHSVLRNLFEEVGWEEDLAREANVMSEELQRIHEELQTWESMTSASEREGLAKRLRVLAVQLRRLGRMRQELGSNDHDVTAEPGAEQAADGLDTLATSLSDGPVNAMEIGESLGAAVRAACQPSHGGRAMRTDQ
ncbi:MAG TPA: hypothetical protein VHZ02_06170 [Acidimicrobiales bacterium]|jgi:hypothetical protein|nr:hypothetical protein [Acidimicrobiales bacterium]